MFSSRNPIFILFTSALIACSGCADLQVIEPSPGATVSNNPVEMTVTWNRAIDPATLKLNFDGQDITQQVLRVSTNTGANTPDFTKAGALIWQQNFCGTALGPQHTLSAQAMASGRPLPSGAQVIFTAANSTPRTPGPFAESNPKVQSPDQGGGLINATASFYPTSASNSQKFAVSATPWQAGFTSKVMFSSPGGQSFGPFPFNIETGQYDVSTGGGLCATGPGNVGVILSGDADNNKMTVSFIPLVTAQGNATPVPPFIMNVPVSFPWVNTAQIRNIWFSPDCTVAMVIVDDNQQTYVPIPGDLKNTLWANTYSIFLVDLLGLAPFDSNLAYLHSTKSAFRLQFFEPADPTVSPDPLIPLEFDHAEIAKGSDNCNTSVVLFRKDGTKLTIGFPASPAFQGIPRP